MLWLMGFFDRPVTPPDSIVTWWCIVTAHTAAATWFICRKVGDVARVDRV